MFVTTSNAFVFIFLIKTLIVPNDGARILAVFPVPSISHQIVFRPLTQELARRGHQLVIITPDPAFSKELRPENITEIDVHDLSYDFWAENFVRKIKGNSNEATKIMLSAFEILIDLFEHQIKTKEVQDLMKSRQQFDLIFTEANVRQTLVMSHVFKAPVIKISSLGGIPPDFQVMGAPSHPLFYPEFIRKRLYNMSIWETINGAYEDFHLRYKRQSFEKLENDMIKRNFGPNAPTVAELNENVDMLFLNVDPIWDGNRPVPPGVIYLGNLHQKPKKDLPSVSSFRKYLISNCTV